ncbi:hypothetical protein SBA3_1270003 [Candidatus Sulfopaludibacter sp. SbA3]|nr:hypothetical protein SBA3_1270003 [Candidatus Sulfopaludibacter sp. SbA3]
MAQEVGDQCLGLEASNAADCVGLSGREFDRRQDRRRYQVSRESQTRGIGIKSGRSLLVRGG